MHLKMIIYMGDRYGMHKYVVYNPLSQFLVIITLFGCSANNVVLWGVWRFGEVTEWSNKPSVKVAVTVDAHRIMDLVMDCLINS